MIHWSLPVTLGLELIIICCFTATTDLHDCTQTKCEANSTTSLHNKDVIRKGTTKVNRNNPLVTMNACAKFFVNPAHQT